MIGDIVEQKDDISKIRENVSPWMNDLTNGVKLVIDKYGFYPNVFYNENDINDPIRGIRNSITNIDDYPGIFIHQDAPDTPIKGYKGIEFRSSITKSIKKDCGNKQLLWTVQNLTDLVPPKQSEYCETPSVQFCGTVVFMANGQIFPQQQARLQSLIATGLSGLNIQLNVKKRQFINGAFVDIGGEHLTDEGYHNLISQYPYGLSVRGWGNWDYRFYELIASGRIPVHINTDDELLFERDIPWDDYIIRIDNLNDIRQKVNDFHSQFSDNKTLGLHQKKLIKLYNDYLSFPAFCKRFEKYYEDDINKLLKKI